MAIYLNPSHIASATSGQHSMTAPLPPSYFIYGESSRPVELGYLHVERVSDRQQLHRGKVERHRHPHLHQLSLWHGNGGEYHVEGETHALTRDTLTWMPMGVIHGFDIAEESDAIVISISDTFLRAQLSQVSFGGHEQLVHDPAVIALDPSDAGQFRHYFESAAREYAFPGMFQETALGALTQLALVSLVRVAQGRERSQRIPVRATPLFEQFLALVAQHFAERWGIEHYAGRLATTPYKLNQVCLAATGLRPSDLIRKHVVQEAKRLLLFTALDAAQVGFSVGYEDAAHFGRMFSRATGLSPGAWRADQWRHMAHPSQRPLAAAHPEGA